MEKNHDPSSSIMDTIEITKNQWLGFGLVFLITWCLSFFLWFQVELDKTVLFALNNSNFGDGFVKSNQILTRYGMSMILLIYTSYLILALRLTDLKNGRPIFLFIIFSFAVAGISGDLLKELIDRTRPIHEYTGQLRFLTGSETPSFPSGHATKSVALVLPFLFFAAYKRRFHLIVKWVLVLLSLWVCFSRIVLGAHYLSDVLAGIGWVFISLPFSVLIGNRMLKKMTRERFEVAAKIWILVYIGLMIIIIHI